MRKVFIKTKLLSSTVAPVFEKNKSSTFLEKEHKRSTY